MGKAWLQAYKDAVGRKIWALFVFPFVVRGCAPNTKPNYRETRNMD